MPWYFNTYSLGAQVHIYREIQGTYENASTEKVSTNVQRWKVQVCKNEVRLSWGGKCKYKQCR